MKLDGYPILYTEVILSSIDENNVKLVGYDVES